MIPLYKNKQIRNFESYLAQANICSPKMLMIAAAQAAFLVLREYWPDANRIVICCGKGNNGGDGYELARIAYEQGLNVTVYSVGAIEELSPLAQAAALAAHTEDVPIYPYQNSTFFQADVIVDALLGSGLEGEVRDPYTQIIASINSSPIPVLSLDIPSGVEADRGQVLGVAVHANVTITFIGLKQGLFTYKAPAYCGSIVVDQIGIPDKAFQKLAPSAFLLDWPHVKPLLSKRFRNAHKGDYGHVLVVGGDYGMGGAVRMAAEAAMRVGAGLVSVATRPEHAPVVTSNRPELMCHQIFRPEDLEPLIERATVLVIGPGLGKTDWARSLLDRLLETPQPKIVDADALNLLSEKMLYRDNWILTPHPGEASRLLDCTISEIQEDRFSAVDRLLQRYGGITVLKGAGTIIQSNLSGIESLPVICAAGNPGMATGGMGDILSGIIGGLVAQKLPLFTAAKVGVLIHSLAADKAAAKEGERGLIATDLLSYLRSLVNPE